MRQKLNCPLAVFAGLLLLAGLLVTPGSAVATAPVGTPGPAGEVYLVRVGVASELLPSAPSDDDRLILALEILRPGEDPEWIEVPESEGVSANASHFALFEETSGTLFLVWQTRIGSHPVIKLASFRDGAWADVIPVSDNIWNFKGHPRLAVTRDTFTVEKDGEVRTVERTFLHVVWWEDTLEGTRVLYRPLILESGRLQGMGDVYVLNDLIDLPGNEDPDVEPSRSLLESPVLQPGRDSSTVLTAFVDARSGRLVVAEIRLLPMGLGQWAGEIEDFVAGYQPEQPSDEGEGYLHSFAGRVRSSILIAGQRHHLNPRAVGEIAQDVYDGVVSGAIGTASDSAGNTGADNGTGHNGGDLRSLAGPIRSSILIAGARIAGETLDRFNQAVAPSVLEIATASEGSGEGSEASATAPHLVRTQLLSSNPAPELGAEVGAQPQLLVSPDGTDVIVAWPEPSALAYRKTIAGSWSDVRRMSLSDELTLTDALEILRRSVRPVH
jgi:hypothetical protein